MKGAVKLIIVVGICGLLDGRFGLVRQLSAATSDDVAQIQNPVQPEGRHENAGGPQENYVESFAVYSPIVIGIFPLLVLAYQTRIFGGQHRIMNRQAALMERQAEIGERLERPLMLAFPADVVGYKGAPDKSVFPAIRIEIKNYGRSTAIVRYCAAAIVVGNNAPPKRTRKGNSSFFWAQSISDYGSRLVAYSKHYWITRAIPPGEAVAPFDVSYNGTLTPAEVDEIGTGHQHVWIDGVLFYQDVFGTKRETNFRWLYDRHLDLLIVDGGAEFNGYT